MIAILTTRLIGTALLLELDPHASRLRDAERRVTRTATLDGGSVIDDLDYSDSDSDMTLVIQSPTDADARAMQGLMSAADGTQRIATRDGVFEGSLQQVDVAGGQLAATFWIRTRLSP